MKKILWVTLLSCMTIFSQLSAQCIIQPIVPGSGLIQKSQLWNLLVINNSKSAITGKVEMIVTNKRANIEEFSGATSNFDIPVGSKQFNAATLGSIQYVYFNAGDIKSNNDFLPIGNYTVCYKLSSDLNKQTQLAEECISIDVEPLSPPQLSFPENGTDMQLSPNQFIWTPPTPINLFNNIRYDFILVELFPEQKKDEAIQQNLPIYSENNITTNTVNFKTIANQLSPNKNYVWQVIARDDKEYAAKSEAWSFKIVENAKLEQIIKGTPYVKLQMNNPELAIAPNGILKMNYSNRSNDSTVEITVFQKDSKQSNGTSTTKTYKVQSGENNLKIDLKKEMGLKSLNEGKLYSVNLVNSKKESWVLNFQIKNF